MIMLGNIICGKLILIKPKDYGNGSWYGITMIRVGNIQFHPILIDTKNPIKKGDEYIYFGGYDFSNDNYTIRTCESKENEITANLCRNTKGNSGWKILVMPDEFPKDVVAKIQKGEIKDLQNVCFENTKIKNLKY